MAPILALFTAPTSSGAEHRPELDHGVSTGYREASGEDHEAIQMDRVGFPMKTPAPDERSAGRRATDERVAREPRRAPLALPPEATSSPVETHLARFRRRPLAVEGVVENGLVRPVDPAVKLPERARVIIVATEQT